jgi:hypothetical protein
MPKAYPVESEDSEDEDFIKRKKTRKRKKKLGRAPRCIVPLKNADKKRHESYKPGQNPIRFPAPFRAVCLGKVNSGKSLLTKHILLAHQGCAPKFEQVIVVHGMTDTNEYDDIEPDQIRSTIPHYDELDPDVKKLILIDDLDFTNFPKEEMKKLSELFRFGSSHRNTSIILSHQSWFRVPKICKDTSNVFVIFRPHDNEELGTIARRVGMDKKVMFDLFKELLPHWRDSLLINLIPGAPYKYGRNLFEPIDIVEEEEV